MNLEEYALYYAELGYAVFPLQPGTKVPFAGSRGVLDASVDSEIISDWWLQEPDANIGLSTCNLCVLDVDLANHPWLAKIQQISCSAISMTPRGGYHYYYKQHDQQPIRNSAGKLADKIDIRGDGGYVVAPPSRIDDATYNWAPHCELTDDIDSLELIPDWLSQAIENTNQTAPSLSKNNGESNTIPDGQRNSTLVSLAGNMRRCGMGEEEICSALLVTNTTRCNPPMDEAEVKRIARSISRYEPDQTAVAVAEHHIDRIQILQDEPTFINADQYHIGHESLGPKVIEGILRQGETMNIVAAPKVGKSWLVLDMALAIATGRVLCKNSKPNNTSILYVIEHMQ
ncbi:MAG: bifunctional DNA primase/polymerase [Planctomycetes bacterium]|nr:bifunctional DNA primase/polymerase [Planctomycetota bacterium]